MHLKENNQICNYFIYHNKQVVNLKTSRLNDIREY